MIDTAQSCFILSKFLQGLSPLLPLAGLQATKKPVTTEAATGLKSL